MKAILTTPVVTFELEANTPRDLFKLVAETQEVFGERCCGLCASENLRYVCRTNQGYDFYELHCNDCAARLTFGQAKARAGHLFPIRKLTAEGKPSWKDGQESASGGWTLFRGDVDRDHGEPPAEPSRPAQPARNAEVPAIPRTLEELKGRLSAKEKDMVTAGQCRNGELFEAARQGAGLQWIDRWDSEALKRASAFAASFIRTRTQPKEAAA